MWHCPYYYHHLHYPILVRGVYSLPTARACLSAARLLACRAELIAHPQIINIAKLVWAFSITPGTHPTTGLRLAAEDIDDAVETQWTNGFLTAPKPFPVAIEIRSAAHQAVVDRECREAQAIFREYE